MIELYEIHGMVVESELELEAQVVAGEPEREVDDAPVRWRISLEPDGVVPREPPTGERIGELCFGDFAFWACSVPDRADLWSLRYAGVCDATLDASTGSISIRRDPSADWALVKMIATGSICAHALAAAGHVAFHASAVARAGRAVAILGPSGHGKSTLAAMLCAGGAELVSDDALRIEARGDHVVCFPGTSVLRLRSSAAEFVESLAGAEVAQTADGRIAVSPTVVEGEVALSKVVVPLLSKQAADLTLQPLSAKEGFLELARTPRLIGWRAEPQVAGAFRAMAEIAPRVSFARATVPWGSPLPPDALAALLA